MVQHQLYGLRGKAYAAKYKQFYCEDGLQWFLALLKEEREAK